MGTQRTTESKLMLYYRINEKKAALIALAKLMELLPYIIPYFRTIFNLSLTNTCSNDELRGSPDLRILCILGIWISEWKSVTDPDNPNCPDTPPNHPKQPH